MKKLILFFILMVLIFLQGCTSTLQKQTEDFTSKIPIPSDSSLTLNDNTISEADKNKIEISKVFGETAKQFKEKLEDKHEIILINDKPITYDEFIRARIMNNAVVSANNGSNFLSDKEILDKVIRYKFVSLLADKMGIYPSQDELSTYSNKERNAIEQNANPLILTAFTDTLGISVDEYWEEWAVPFDRQLLISKKVGKELAKDVIRQSGETDEEYQKRIFDNYEKVYQDFIKKQEIKFIDDKFKDLN